VGTSFYNTTDQQKKIHCNLKDFFHRSTYLQLFLLIFNKAMVVMKMTLELTVIRLQQSYEHVDGGGLAGAIMPQQSQDLVLLRTQGQTCHRHLAFSHITTLAIKNLTQNHTPTHTITHKPTLIARCEFYIIS